MSHRVVLRFTGHGGAAPWLSLVVPRLEVQVVVQGRSADAAVGQLIRAHVELPRDVRERDLVLRGVSQVLPPPQVQKRRRFWPPHVEGDQRRAEHRSVPLRGPVDHFRFVVRVALEEAVAVALVAVALVPAEETKRNQMSSRSSGVRGEGGRTAE